MIRSLRMRLFLGATAVTVLVLGVLSIGIDQAVHRTLQAVFDNVLLEKARTIASLVEQSGERTHFDFQPAQFPEFEAGPRCGYFEVVLDGESYQRSASLGQGHLPLAGGNAGAREAHSFTLPDGRKGRLLVMAFVPLADTVEPGGGGGRARPVPQGMIAVAQDSSMMERTLGRLRLLFLGLGGAATLLSGVLLVWVTSRAVRPVGRLAAQIEGLSEADLAAVTPARDLPTELMPMVDRLNGLLGRLGEAFGRERAFTADVAHELRTPLAGILATLEVARSRPRDSAGYETAIDKSLAILLQMQGLVENLLLLARAESGQLAVRWEPVDLGVLVEECRAAFEESAARRGLRFALEEADMPAVSADREILRVVLYNVLDNAVSYAAAGSEIGVRVSGAASGGGGAAVEVANVGHALREDDLPRLFGRFVRKDAARSATGAHAGLGLSICQRLVALQGGRIALRLEGDKFVARVELGANGPGGAVPISPASD